MRDKPLDPEKLASRHGMYATFALLVALITAGGVAQFDGWIGIVCGVLCGASANIAVRQVIKASTYASAQTSVDVLLEVAKRGKR